MQVVGTSMAAAGDGGAALGGGTRLQVIRDIVGTGFRVVIGIPVAASPFVSNTPSRPFGG